MNDEFYMNRCLELASMGMGSVSPNPMVGCVIVHEQAIIGEGYHQQFGSAHAEVNAVQAVIDNFPEKASELLRNATVYVNLEPCAHFGKTPPCADLLIKHQVKKVVIANTDPFADVNGKGIQKLKEAGITVSTNILQSAGAFLNRRFFTRVSQQRPYIILKWAQTADGYFAPSAPSQKWISGAQAKQFTMQWRAEEDAIVVGKQTALIDDPALTNRSGKGKNPIRIVIDRSLDIPLSRQLFNAEAKTIVFNEVKTEVVSNIHYVQMEDMQYYLAQKIAYQLYLMDIQSVMIEGGRQILDQFISHNLWDEARIFTAKTKWNEGIKAPVLKGNLIFQEHLETDDLSIYTPCP
ncbi:MAG: bifunctional diaminohydroxyphosphoribosylaminopyrimidine deaminase/5-amino-6-(5-phosphoribosylamino)uracil reductase RibD [Pedobacter sp.]